MSNVTPATDWQVSHTENAGKATVVANFADDAGATNPLVISVKGPNHAKFADKLAALLQSEGVSSHQV
jgi:hypothetical protein